MKRAMVGRAHFLTRRILRGVLAASALLLLALPAAAQDIRSIGLTPGPARQPVYSPTQQLGTEIGRVRIPAIDLDETIRAGVDLSVLNEGVGHWVGTAAPGGSGNLVLAGHRTTYGAPFHDLDRLRRGDLIYLAAPNGMEVLYRVTESFVVAPDDIWITFDGEEPMVTLFACHPKGSARYRIVVRGGLVAGGRIA